MKLSELCRPVGLVKRGKSLIKQGTSKVKTNGNNEFINHTGGGKSTIDGFSN